MGQRHSKGCGQSMFRNTVDVNAICSLTSHQHKPFLFKVVLSLSNQNRVHVLSVALVNNTRSYIGESLLVSWAEESHLCIFLG